MIPNPHEDAERAPRGAPRGGTSAPTLSVVIPTRNRRDLVARTLPTVLRQDLPPGAYEVVVVSDGSTDGTVEYVAALDTPVPLRVLDLPRHGLASARNAGIAAARGEIVLLMDDDMRCPPTLAAAHLAAHADDAHADGAHADGAHADGARAGGRCVACGPTRTAPESRPGLATDFSRRWYDAYAQRLTQEGGARSPYDVWVTSGCSAPRALLAEHGGYDERFLYAEDAELAIRLWHAGVRFRFLPAAVAYEIYSKSAADVVRADAPRLGVSELQMCRKFPAYTRHSRLASVIHPSRITAFLAWACAALPVSPEFALAPAFWIAERLGRSATMRDIGLRLLRARLAAAALRAAVPAAGSWAKLRRELQAQADAASSQSAVRAFPRAG